MMTLFVLLTSPFGLLELRVASLAYSFLLLVILLFLIPISAVRKYL